jgi:hypothetical protein
MGHTRQNRTRIFAGDSLVNGVPACLATDDEEDEDDEEVQDQPRAGWVVGINQMVWEPATNTLYAEADEPLHR